MHSIRLRGPWDYEILQYDSQATPVGTAGRTTVPSDWSDTLGSKFRGRVRYTRRFHSPTGLDLDERVWLVLEEARSGADISLNGSGLGAAGAADFPVRYEVGPLLKESNLLVVDVVHPSGASELAGGLVGEVRLEIE